MSFLKRKNQVQFPVLVILFLSMLFLSFVGTNNEPLPLALAYAACSAGLPPFYVLLPLPFFTLFQNNIPLFLLTLAQCIIFFFCFVFEKRLRVSNPRVNRNVVCEFLKMLSLTLALGGFVAFAPFQAYTLSFGILPTLTPITQKVLIAAACFLLSACFSVCVKALLRKFYKCRLNNDELLFSLLLCTLIGVGICNLLSVNAYLGISFFVLLVFSYTAKDATTFLCAFLLSLPPLLVAGLSPERFFVYGVALTLFCKSGKLACTCAFLTVFFTYGYIDGIYAYPTNYLIQSILSALLPCLTFTLLPSPALREIENRFIFYREKHLSRIAINRNRAAIGEQLYELSSVFKEIQSTFISLSGTEAEDCAKAYVCASVIEESCQNCPQYQECMQKDVFPQLTNLVAIGCMKGKVTLIDVPSLIAANCVKQSDLLYAVNRQLGDYKKYMLEAENAANGRALLAGQAQGVSEILKNLALEQSEPLRIYTDKEHALSLALMKVGVVCSEVLLYGEQNNLTLSLITFGQADVTKIAAVASHVLAIPMMISKRLTLSNDKFCCILRKKPAYDAAFGVATIKKQGEISSGDTHSVLKIDERRFLVALSDGMGSGDYARRISESTISLLESFYRAKMPSENVLPTVNKLLTFSKEETFACVDIAIIDLDDGNADIVKIGSPVGFILSGNTVKVLEGGSLPLGILDSLRPDFSSHTLLENDVLLFMSDGVSDAFGSTTDLYETLKTLPLHNPQQLCDLLLKRALGLYKNVAKDDMTVIAVRLFPAT